GAGSIAAQLVRQGASVLYILLYGHVAGGAGQAHTAILRSTDGGAGWQGLAHPGPRAGLGWDATPGLAAAPGGFATVLGLPRSGTGTPSVRTSADNGSSWSPPRPVPGGTRDHLDLIAAADAAHLVLATSGETGEGPFRYELLAS